ncbi:MAG: pyruvate, phosphate dikinase [Candidatus Hydrogenedentota bacterium]
MAKKRVYFFGGGKAEGRGNMRELLGGKGANLAEMANIGVPVPAGFTITTEMCTEYYESGGTLSKPLMEEIEKALRKVERTMKKKFGDPKNPLLVSVRSGARMSMPGMMETVLNVGLSPDTLPGLIDKTGDERFAYDAYRRLITMYADVVMEKAQGIELPEGETVREKLEHAMEAMKRRKGVTEDVDLDADDLNKLCDEYKDIVQETLGESFPDDPMEQLTGAIRAVFQSWFGKRAVHYRRIEGIPEEWGTAVNVQAMVFGNMGNNSATGVAFTRNPATGEDQFYGEWLVNAQGEDVVAGIRTPYPLNKPSQSENNKHLPTLHQSMPDVYKELEEVRNKLEKHYQDMQDVEFTIEEGKLWMLQTRAGKRTGVAAIRMAVEMCEKKLIDQNTAIKRVKPSQLDELLHPMLDPDAEEKAQELAYGLPAGPGGGVGQAVFTADDAAEWAKQGRSVVLVRNETSPEDVHGMHVAEAIVTAKGGMTSHAALVARGWGKCCVVGAAALEIDARDKELRVDGHVIREGDWLSVNGTRGRIYADKVGVLPADPARNRYYKKLMKWVDDTRQINVRTNAETHEDAEQALAFNAEGIGLARTEHMFFQPERIVHVREMILADDEKTRRDALMKLLPYQKEDFKEIFRAMKNKPVTIRLLDPPLHEFLTLDDKQVQGLAEQINVPAEKIKARMAQLHELNPMLGHRGCRLGIAYPEITEMQVRAILEATAELTKDRVRVYPEIMIPLVGHENEFNNQEQLVRDLANDVAKQYNAKLNYMVGTMIEVPRACLVADKIAERAEFFSFGTNDLTQMGFGFSRDDIGGFLPYYIDQKILPDDPFQSLDQEGIGQLVRTAVEKGRATKPELKLGICGEHGGDPDSVIFCHNVGLDYVSCSPFRVPIARLAAAHAALDNPRKTSGQAKSSAATTKPASKSKTSTKKKSAAKKK